MYTPYIHPLNTPTYIRCTKCLTNTTWRFARKRRSVTDSTNSKNFSYVEDSSYYSIYT